MCGPWKSAWMTSSKSRRHWLSGLIAIIGLGSSLASFAQQPPSAAEIAGYDGLFKAVWADGQHVSELEVVKRIADQADLDGGRLVAEAQSPESKALLRARTDEAIAAGVFGGALVIAAVGFADDRLRLSPWLRLGVQGHRRT